MKTFSEGLELCYYLYEILSDDSRRSIQSSVTEHKHILLLNSVMMNEFVDFIKIGHNFWIIITVNSKKLMNTSK